MLAMGSRRGPVVVCWVAVFSAEVFYLDLFVSNCVLGTSGFVLDISSNPQLWPHRAQEKEATGVSGCLILRAVIYRLCQSLI